MLMPLHSDFIRKFLPFKQILTFYQNELISTYILGQNVVELHDFSLSFFQFLMFGMKKKKMPFYSYKNH